MTQRSWILSLIKQPYQALFSIFFCLVVRPRIHPCTSKPQHLLVRYPQDVLSVCVLSVCHSLRILHQSSPHPYLCHGKWLLGAVCWVLHRSATAFLVYQAKLSLTAQWRWKTNDNHKKKLICWQADNKIYSDKLNSWCYILSWGVFLLTGTMFLLF